MSDQTETIAAIVAEMRGNEFDDPHLDADGIIGARRLARDWADRIEAAAKRERATLEDALSHCREYAEKIERENEEGETRLDAEEIIATVDNEFAGIRPARTPGNSAALREALVAFVDSIQWLCDGDERGIFKRQFAPLLSEARAALAASARNCDRFNNATEAGLAYRNLVWARAGRVVDIDENTFFAHLANWLFTPAKQEGGAR